MQSIPIPNHKQKGGFCASWSTSLLSMVHSRSRRKRVDSVVINPNAMADWNIVHLLLFLPVPVVPTILPFSLLHALYLALLQSLPPSRYSLCRHGGSETRSSIDDNDFFTLGFSHSTSSIIFASVAVAVTVLGTTSYASSDTVH